MDNVSSAEANLSVLEGIHLHLRLCVASVIFPPLKMAEHHLAQWGTEESIGGETAQ